MYGHLYGPLNRPRKITVAAQRIPCGSHLITIVVGTPNHKDPIGSRWIPHGSRRFSIVFRLFLRMPPERIFRIPSDPARILSVYLFCCTRFYVDPVRILSDPGTFLLSIVRFCAWSLTGSCAPATGFLCFSYAFLKGSRADPAGSCTDPEHFLTKARRNLNIFELQC